MEYDSELMQVMLREPLVRQLMADMSSCEQAGLTRLRVMQPFTDPLYADHDTGNSRLFAELFGEQVRYVKDRGCWFCYENGVWKLDHGEARTMELSRLMARMLHVLSYTLPDEHLAQEGLRRAMRLYGLNVRQRVIREAGTFYPLLSSDFDADPWLFNCLNGVLDLRTGELRPHHASDLLSKQAGVAYDPGASCPRWDAFIQQIMSVPGQQQLTMDGCAAPDPAPEKAAYLQRALGYALTGSTKEEGFFVLHGQTTRNGKGTLMETMVRMLGDYARVARPETISSRFSHASGPNEDVARLHNARLVSISEPDRTLTLSAGLIKQMTGRDTLTARNLHESSFQFQPQFKLFINTNHLPSVDDMTLFSSQRVRVIPFERHFAADEQDKDLKELFAQPQNLSAVLNWCLEGLQAWRQQGLGEPEAIQRATDRYRRENDLIAQFCDACLQPEKGAYVRTREVYLRYRAWCEENGEHPDNNRIFWKQMGHRGVTIKRMRPAGGNSPVIMLLDHRLAG